MDPSGYEFHFSNHKCYTCTNTGLASSQLESSVLYIFVGVKSDAIKCTYLPARDRIVFTDGIAVGARRDQNGILLLDTALQTPVNKTEDIIKVELSLPDVCYAS